MLPSADEYHVAMLSESGAILVCGSTSGWGTSVAMPTPYTYFSERNIKIVDLVVTARSTLFLTSDHELYVKRQGNPTQEFPFGPGEGKVRAIFGHRHLAACSSLSGEFAVFTETTICRYNPADGFPKYPVVQASFGFAPHTHCAVTENGELYGLIGTFQEEETRVSAVKLMDNVKDVSCGSGAVCVLTRDGKLFTWGEKRCECVTRYAVRCSSSCCV